jgi:hypothetical protein
MLYCSVLIPGEERAHMDPQTTRLNAIQKGVKERLETHQLLFKFKDRGINGSAPTFGDPDYNTGFIELKAIKRGRHGEYAYSRIMRNDDLGKLSVADFVDGFCREALGALGSVEAE